MNTSTLRRQGNIQAWIGGLALLIGGLALSNNAHATAAGATILNVVQVNWSDAGGNSFDESDSVDVTVDLLEATPTLSTEADDSGTSGDTVTYTYRLTTTANGADTYTIGSSSTATSNLTSNADATSTNSITLNASVIVSDNNDDSINIPAGSGSGFAGGETVTINGVDYVVNAVTAGTAASHTNASGVDGAAGTTTAETYTTVTLFQSDGVTAADFSATDLTGFVLAEYQTFTLDVDGVVDPTGGDSGTDTVEVSADDGVSTAATTSNTTTFYLPKLTITKTSDVANAKPGDSVEYTITVTNSSANADASNVYIEDTLSEYVTFDNTGNYNGGADSIEVVYTDLYATDGDSSATAYYTSGTDTQVQLSGSTLRITLGESAGAASTPVGGTIDRNSSKVVIKFKVTVD